MREPRLDEKAIDNLVACAAAWSGHQPEGVAREAVRRVLAHELASGASTADVIRRAEANDPALVTALRAAASVRETYFFRHPEQFELVAARVPRLAPNGVIRAWSAGCATGEETWSIAATLIASLPPTAAAAHLAVVGSDTHERSLEVARKGTYASTSVRASAPLLYPVVRGGKRLEVLDQLRQITTFVTHDLRDPEPGQFELIFCRNVLIYFTPQAVRIALDRLVNALAPGGLIVFGTMDVSAGEIARLVRVGPPELMTFTNVRPAPRRRPTTRKQPARAKSASVSLEAVALHRSALMWFELGGRGNAEKVLADLNRLHPEYLPGILERALVHDRRGEHAMAEERMQEVLRRTDAMAPEDLVVGLEPLPATFYRDAARAYLDRSATRGGKR